MLEEMGICSDIDAETLEFRVLRRIEPAVRSIMDCTDPEVWCREIVAQGKRFASPYISRKRIKYMFSWKPLPPGVLFAQSFRYTLLAGEVTDPETAVQAFPKTGLVTQWEGGRVPFYMVKPVYRLAREMGLRPWAPWDEDSLIYTWVLSPVLWGWHYGAPIFVAAADENKNEPARVLGEPILTQGSMLFVPATEENRPFGPFFIEPWAVARGNDLREGDLSWFYNHYAIAPGSTLHPDTVLVTQRSVHPIGVRYNEVQYACVAITGPAIIWARDHEPVSLPEGEYFALHPLVDD